MVDILWFGKKPRSFPIVKFHEIGVISLNTCVP